MAISPPPAAPEPPPPAPPAAEPADTHRLIATAGLLSGRTFTLGPQGLLIGRDPASCQVVLADDEVSRAHAWVGLDEMGQVVVRDRKSANGTYVNQVRVQERVLRPTDELAIGLDRRHLFRIETIAAPSPTPKAPRPSPPLAGVTSVVPPQRLTAAVAAVQPEEKAERGTVAIKLTDLMARPHVELIVDKYAVKTLEVPDPGLNVGRDASRCQVLMEHP